MADGGKNEATFKVNLDTANVNGAASSAADKLQQLERSITGDTKALREMQAAMKQLQGSAAVDIATYRNLQGRIDAMKNRVSAARGEFINLGGRFTGIKRPIQEGGSAMTRFGEAASRMNGPLGSSIGKLQSLASSVGASGAIALGFAAIAAAALATVAAIAAATVALIKFGLASASARREEKLRLEGLTKMRFIWREMTTGQRMAAESADFLQNEIDKVSSKVALARPQIEAWEARLYKLGLRGGNLQNALEGVSMAASTVGDSQAEMYLGLMMSSAQMGHSVKKVADDIRARLGPLAEKQLLSWSVQSEKLRENLGRLFADVGIENFLRPLKMVTEMFSQNETTGRVLKGIFERLFKPLEQDMPVVAMAAKRFIQGMVYGALLIENAWLQLSIGLIKLLGPSLYKRLTSAAEGFDAMTMAVHAGSAAVVAMVTPTAVFVGGLVAIGIAAKEAVLQLGKLYGMFGATDAVKAKQPKWQTAGQHLIKGLINGMLGGIPELISAAAKAGGAALDALSKKLKLGSPSRATFQFGAWTGEGMIGGIRAKTSQVRQAVQHMIELPRRAAAAINAPTIELGIPERRSAQPNARARQGAPITIQNLTVQAPPTDKPQDFARAVKQALINELEGLAIELGAPVAA